MVIIVNGVFVPNRPVEVIEIFSVATPIAIAQRHHLLGLPGRESACDGFGAINNQATSANMQRIGNRKVAEVSGTKLDIATLVDCVDTNPLVLAISRRDLAGG